MADTGEDCEEKKGSTTSFSAFHKVDENIVHTYTNLSLVLATL